MKKVFLVHHSHHADDAASSEETKLIGVYSTKSKAQQAVRRLRKQPGFKRLPKHFTVDLYVVDMDHWTEGFVTETAIRIYSVWRTNPEGKITLVGRGLVQAEALRLIRDRERSDKKNKYWAREHA